MVRKRYYFPYVAPNHCIFHVAVTSKTLIERLDEVVGVFKKYSQNSSPMSPRHILFLMSQQNASLLKLSEFASAPKSESTSPENKLSPGSSSPGKISQSDSSLKRKRLAFGESAKPDQKYGSTISRATDLASTSRVQLEKFSDSKSSSLSTAMTKVESSKKKSQKQMDISSGVQECSSSSGTAELAKEPDSESPTKEFKIPVLPGKEESKSAKRLRRFESSLDLIPEKLSPVKEVKTAAYSTEDVKMDISPNRTTCVQEYVNRGEMAKETYLESPTKEFKIPVLPGKEDKEVSKPAKRPRLFDSLDEIPKYSSRGKKAKVLTHPAEDDEMDASPTKSDEMYDSPSKDIKATVFSPDKIESPQKFEKILDSIPIIKEDGIEVDMSSMQEEIPGTSCTTSSAEMENLIDDPSRVESIKKEVEARIKGNISPKKIKGDFSPSKKTSSYNSPRKSKIIKNTGKDMQDKTQDPIIKSPSILSHPNVMSYLKLRLKSVLSHRNKYMYDIYCFFKEFDGDMRFLYFYASTVSLAVEDIPTEGKVYFTRNVRNLKENLTVNAKDLSDKLRSLLNTLKADIPFWATCLKEIRKLNETHEHFVATESESSISVKFLQDYEQKLRIIWEKMDRRVLLGEGLRSSLLEISTNFIKLTKDFSKYLILVELMKPSSLTSSEGDKKRLRISWH